MTPPNAPTEAGMKTEPTHTEIRVPCADGSGTVPIAVEIIETEPPALDYFRGGSEKDILAIAAECNITVAECPTGLWQTQHISNGQKLLEYSSRSSAVFGLLEYPAIRKHLVDSHRELSKLPAKWSEDSSLETWFPYSAEELILYRKALEQIRDLSVAMIDAAKLDSVLHTEGPRRIKAIANSAINNTTP